MSQPSVSPPATPAPDGAATTSERGGVKDALRTFATTDPRTLGLFRIAFGVFLLVDLYRRLPDYVFFYTNEGMLPNHAAIYRPMSGYLFSVYHAFSTRGEVLAAFGLTAVLYLLYLVGWKTRLMQVLTLVAVTSLHSRNIMLENGGDVVSNLLALWTCFLPLGRRFSLDALIASMRETNEHGADELNDRTSPFVDRRAIVSLAVPAIVLNLAFIYFFNTIHKDGAAWREATSVHYVLWADRLVNPLGVALRQVVPPIAINIMTTGTLVIESSICVLLLSPFWIRSCRRVAALMIIMLHCGFQTVGHFGLFSFVMMLHSILLLGPEDWDALARRMRERLPSRVVYYDAACGVCHQFARLLKRLDHLDKVRFVGNDSGALPAGITEADTQETLIVTDALGTKVWKFNDAITQALRAIPYGVFLAKLLELPGIHALARAGYVYFAKHRQSVSQELGYAACGLPQSFGGDGQTPKALRPPVFGKAPIVLRELALSVFIVALGSQMLAENRKVPQRLCLPNTTHCLPWNLKQQPRALAAIAQYPRFFEGWSMFAPIPPLDDGKLVVDAVTVDGRHVDPLAGGAAPEYEMPPLGEGLLMTQLWYEFHERIRRDANTRYRPYFQDWIINWHKIEKRPANDQIVSFEVYWVSRPTQPPFERRRLDSRRTRIMNWSAPDASSAPPSSAQKRFMRNNALAPDQPLRPRHLSPSSSTAPE